ncbi:hypothetical protein JXA47_07860 [Candidatus Sumerlaeota bacterium]|nr:hypothetical protein [Candidatus Sumerlaeota bacterium]
MTETSPPADQTTEASPPAPMEDDQPFALRDYLVVNAAFIAFLAILYVLMIKLFPNTGGLTVFFVILAVGFIAVSIYDFLFDRLWTPPADEERDEA